MRVTKFVSWRKIKFAILLVVGLIILYVGSYLVFRSAYLMSSDEYADKYGHDIDPFHRALVIESRIVATYYDALLELERDYLKTFVIYKGPLPDSR